MKLEHQSLNDRAYEAIRRNLVSGEVQPGQVLVIRTLAAEFGISATPVRDAMQRLVAERLLIMLPNRGFAVPQLSVDSYLELVRIRTALEGMAGELATPNIRLAQLHQLHQLLLEGEKAAAARDHAAYTRMNQKFHFAIYQQAGSPILLQKIDELWSQVGPFFAKLFDDNAYVPIANEQHRAIIKALEAKDAPRVKTEIIRDIETAAQSLTARMPQMELAG